MRPPVAFALLGLALLALHDLAFVADPVHLRHAPPRPVVPGGGTATARVRVGSFNVWAVPFVAEDLDGRLARMPAALGNEDLDVLCLQEVWTPGARRRLVEGLAPAFTPATAGQGGLLLLSRLPLREARFTPLPVVRGLSVVERLARKGLLVAVVETPAGPLRVATTHLALAFGRGNPRTQQLAFVLDHLDRLREEEDLPTVLAADLNTPPVQAGRLTEDYLAIRARGWEDAKPPRWDPGQGAWTAGPPTRVPWPRGPGRPQHHPDHVFVRGGREGRIEILDFRMALDADEAALSDHNLLVVDLRVHRRAHGPEAR